MRQWSFNFIQVSTQNGFELSDHPFENCGGWNDSFFKTLLHHRLRIAHCGAKSGHTLDIIFPVCSLSKWNTFRELWKILLRSTALTDGHHPSLETKRIKIIAKITIEKVIVKLICSVQLSAVNRSNFFNQISDLIVSIERPTHSRFSNSIRGCRSPVRNRRFGKTEVAPLLILLGKRIESRIRSDNHGCVRCCRLFSNTLTVHCSRNAQHEGKCH